MRLISCFKLSFPSIQLIDWRTIDISYLFRLYLVLIPRIMITLAVNVENDNVYYRLRQLPTTCGTTKTGRNAVATKRVKYDEKQSFTAGCNWTGYLMTRRLYLKEMLLHLRTLSKNPLNCSIQLVPILFDFLTC